MSLVAKLLPSANVLLDLQVSSKKRLFEQVGLLFENNHGIGRSLVFDSLFARERLGSTGLGQGVAIPHGVGEAKSLIHSTGLCVLQFPAGVPFGDELAYLVVGIAGKEDEHLPILQALANMMLDEESFDQLRHAADPAFIYARLTGGGEQA